MANMNLRKRMVLAKTEPVEGADSLPVVETDAVLCGDIEIGPLEGEYKERNIITPFFGSKAKALLGKHVAISFSTELAGMQALGVPTPGLSAMHRCSGLSENITASTKVDYKLVETGHESSTIYFNIDGVLHKLTGARGNGTIMFKANDWPSIKWEVMGLFNAVIDAPAGTPDYSLFKEPVEVNSSNTVNIAIHGHTAAVMASLEVNMGYELKHRDYPGGVEAIRVLDRQSSGSLSIESDKVGDKDWWTICQAGTQGPVTLTHGPAGNQAVITLDATQLTEPKYGDSDGIATLDTSVNILSNITTGGMTLTYQ